MSKRTKLDEAGSSSQVHHLGQIQRANLDFDFEKVCSVTLSPRNVYICLVCGKYLQGLSPDTPLFSHALEKNHLVCMSLQTGQVFTMPEGTPISSQISSSSLEDVLFNFKPKYTAGEIQAFGRLAVTGGQTVRNRDLHGNTYFTGLIPLQGLDYVCAIVQCLVRVDALRDFFLVRENFESSPSVVVKCFGELVCQMFNHRRFKASACPNELLHAIGANSKFTSPGMDASQFLAWFLFELNKGLAPSGRRIITQCFQGEVSMETTLIELKREFGTEHYHQQKPGPASLLQQQPEPEKTGEEELLLGTFTRATIVNTKTETVKFLSLSLDLPTQALFKDKTENQTVIPQTTLLQVLSKYDGDTTVDVPLPGGRLERKRYRIIRLPNYLVFSLKRFTQNQFFLEKNRALVTLPVADLDMAPYLQAAPTSPAMYNLVANVCHSDASSQTTAQQKQQQQQAVEKNALVNGTYKANVYYAPKDAWFEMSDMSVKESMPQLVSVSETFLAFYKRV